MVDPRIRLYLEAAQAMKNGQFDIGLPDLALTLEAQDEIAELGKALMELGQTLEARLTEMRQIVQVTERINAGLLLDDVLEHIYQSFHSIIPYNRIGFSLLDEKTQTITAHWARSDSKAVQIGRGYSASLEGSTLQTILVSGQPRILNDLPNYLAEHPNSESTALIVKEGMQSSLTCPLIAGGKPIGFMFFSSCEKSTYRQVHVEVYRQVAGQLATIVEKARMYEELVNLNQLKNRFLGIAAHDLRNPLAVQKGFIDLLRNQTVGALNQKQMQALDILADTCGEMLALILDLLDVNAIESGRLDLKLQEVDVVEFVTCNHSANEFLATAKSIRLDLEMGPDLGTAVFDPSRVTQVLNNLVSNALKFSYPESAITMSVRRSAEGYEFHVADHGQGIPEDEIPKLFTEFGRASVAPTAGESSTGLGLAIVKKLVEAHHGRVWVESQLGVGSTFGFIIPYFD